MSLLTTLVLPLLLALTLVIGYWVLARVHDEEPVAKHWVTGAHALLSLLLFLSFPWWQAAILVGALLVGWMPALIAFAWIISGPLSFELATYCVGLGLLTGSRWRLDGRSEQTLAYGAFAITLFLLGARALL